MYYFIVNPNSRSGQGAVIWKEIQKILLEKNIKYQVFYTRYRGNATELAEKITSRHEFDRISLIAVGGDGTIQEVLSGIRDLSRVYFGYIPTGSGNDFCRSMKLPQDYTKALNGIIGRHKIYSMDVPCIHSGDRSSRFAISCGIGFDAGVCHEVSVTPMKKILNKIGLGKLVYLFVALKQLLFLTPCSMDLTLDNGEIRHFQKVYFIAVMNQKYEGGGFKFCPDASPDDGTLDIIVVNGLSRKKVLACLPTAFFGKHTCFKGIHLFRSKNVSVQSETALPIHKDGEPAGVSKSFSVSIEDKPIHVYLPN